MRQWHEQKQQAGDAILLFRMGDFYEMFYDDAERAARLLGLALTSRDGGQTPLAGIPHHALETYLARLVAAGHRVAISEQIEDLRLAKGVVERAIVRVVTPGTLTDEALLERTRSNLLAAVLTEGDHAGLAVLELATGRFEVDSGPWARVLDEIGRTEPAEILLPESSSAGRHPVEADLRTRLAAAVTYRPVGDFQAARAAQVLREHYETATLEGFGFREVDLAVRAAGALLAYVRETQCGAARHVEPPRRRCADDYMALDPVTLRSLEVERTLRTGARDGSLLAAVDRTCNPMGARLLRQWLCFPLREPAEIRRRQDLIGALREYSAVRAVIRRELTALGDIERVIGRLGVQRASPRDLRMLGEGLGRLGELRAALRGLPSDEATALAEALDGLEAVGDRLRAALRPAAPLALRDGGIFADGVDPELDRLRALGRDGAAWLAAYQAREAQRTGIPSLKVAFNRVFGFYIEVTHTHSSRVPADYVRKQTMKNAERYITDELKRYEGEALASEARAKELEYELFITLRDEVCGHIPALQRIAATLARLDVLAGWAELAAERGYSRPEFVAEPVLVLRGGRHPVLEQTLGADFVANDAELVAGRACLALITGPNMAGKSTYIRQVALLTLLAHCGCWVPAESFRLGPVDRIFTRVGASDELARGQSTFMVEMLETANILHHATPSSLVILDEIGRGTSTFDGVALAWAITEHLALRCGCRTLFATHYHELTELGELLDPVFNLNVAVREYEDQVVFLHRIVPGAAGRSYGLHVARLAGVPRAVLERANAVLNELEKTFSRESHRPVLAAVQRRRQRQLRLFEEPEERVVRELRELDLTGCDPARAQELIHAWRRMLGVEPPSASASP